MIGNRRTFQQRLSPNSPEFKRLSASWAKDASCMICEYLWQGIDRFRNEVVKPAGGLSSDDLSLERSITQDLAPLIRRAIPIESPYEVQHGRCEMETLKTSKAQPPQYDIAFFPAKHRRLNFPVEAKVLRTDGAVAEYIKEITDNFMTCRYAPLSSEGIMLGYLVSGLPRNVFRNIEKALGQKLKHHPRYMTREHKLSDHKRRVRKNEPYPSDFRCHHVILELTYSLTN